MSDGVLTGGRSGTELPPQFDAATAAWIATSARRRLRTGTLRFGRALRDPGVVIPAGLLILIVLACFAGPALFGAPSPTVGNLTQYLLPLGSPGHLLGTNQLGNDMLSRMLYGGRVSIEIGLAATAVSLVIGVLLGAFCGYLGGAADMIMMRILDILFAFPNIVLAMAIAAYLGPSVIHTIWAISAFAVAGFGRLARAQTVKIRQLDYVVAARSGGASTWRIVTSHIIPGISGPLMTFALIVVGQAMLIEAGLSYLGLGVPIPQPSWGNLISSAQNYVAQAPQLLIMPAVALFVTIASINLLADGLRRRFALDRG
ncbi:MAG TPA: ABC transporter permease [Trebonia sp.]